LLRRRVSCYKEGLENRLPGERCLHAMKTNRFHRRVLMLSAVLAGTVVLALVLAALLAGAALNSPRFVPLAERALRSLTGLSFEIGEIRFRCPLDLTLSGLVVQGDLGGLGLRVRAARVEVRSGLLALRRAALESVRARDLDVSLAVRPGAGAAAPGEGAGTLPEVPPWLWRVRSAEVRNGSLEVEAGNAPLRIAGLNLFWRAGPGSGRGRVTVSLREGRDREDGIEIRVERGRRLTAGASPAALPDLDLAALAAFAGLEPAVAGTVTGTLRVLSGEQGVGGVRLDLRAAGLVPEHPGLAAGFGSEDLALEFEARFPPVEPGRKLPGVGELALTLGVRGSVRGLRIGREPLPRALQPVRFRARVQAAGGLEAPVRWEAEVQDGPGLLALQGQGTVAGFRSGAPLSAEASVRATAADLPGAVALLVPGSSRLPSGFAWAGGAEAVLRLSGALDALKVRGELTARDLAVSGEGTRRLPVRLDAELEGELGAAGVRRMTVSTRGFRIGDLASPAVRIDYTPESVQGRVQARAVDVARLAGFLGPLLPREVRGFQFAGSLDLAAQGQAAPAAGGPLSARFRASLRKGQFTSGDYQQMGEGLDLDVSGSVSVPGPAGPAAVRLDAALSGGEVVYEGLYANLTALRPEGRVEMRADDRSADRVTVRRASLALAGVGALGLSGSRHRSRAGGEERRLRVEVRDLNLRALAGLAREGGFGDRWPALRDLQASGTLALEASFYQGGGKTAARGLAVLQDASVSQESRGISAAGIRVRLPFSLGPAEALARLPGDAGDGQAGGTVVAASIGYRGIAVSGVEARVRVRDDRADLLEPLRAEAAGGRLEIPTLWLAGLTDGERSGRVALSLEGADLAPITRAFLGAALEGSLRVRLPDAGLRGGRGFARGGSVQVQAGEGRIDVDDLRLEGAAGPGGLQGRLRVTADAFPLGTSASAFLHGALAATLDGRLDPVEISGGALEASGELTVRAWDGTIRVSRIQGSGLGGPVPALGMDIEMRSLRLDELSSPLQFGRISGVLEGDIRGLRVGTRFPYLQAFRMNLGTVKTRGVPQRIGARAVENLSKIGGSSALTSAISSGFLGLFDEYHYGRIGVRADLEDGWLELHGIPRGGEEYLILRSWRLPTLSMPLKVLSADRKIRFGSWVSTLKNLGGGQ